MTTVAVLGSGIMGSALAVPLTDNGHEVRLVGTHLDREIIDTRQVEPRSTRASTCELPEDVSAYQLEEAEAAFDGAEIVAQRRELLRRASGRASSWRGCSGPASC